MKNFITEILILFVCLLLCSFNIEAKKWVVSNNGSDNNNGTEIYPFRTILKGAEMAHPGDTVFVLEGIYRERVAPPRGGEPNKPIVYMAEPEKKVFIKGSDVWKPEWNEEEKNIVYAKPPDSLFTDDVYFDNANPFKVTLSSTPWGRDGFIEKPEIFENVRYTLGQVFVDGKMWKQVPLKEELRAEQYSWWYDSGNQNIFLNIGSKDLSQSTVEITTRRRIFAPHKRGLGYIHLIGFIIEHCGNQFPESFWAVKENAQSGSVGTRQGNNWLIKNNIIRFANSIGIDCGAEGPDNERLEETPNLGHSDIENFRHISGTVIEDNFIVDNGSNGIMALGTYNLTIKGNVIMRNNNLHFKGNNRYEQAGIKLHFAESALINNNYVVNNYTWGIWLDNQWPNSRITGNFIANNEKSGIFLELTDYPFDKAIIDNNILYGNVENAVYAHDASGGTFINNLFANTAGNNILNEFGQTFFIRMTGPRDGYAKSKHFSFYNNIQLGSHVVYSVNFPAFLGGEQRFDGNIYEANENDRVFIINPFSGTGDLLHGSLFDSILTVIIDSNPIIKDIQRGQVAQLTFKEWKKFWEKYSNYYDQNSLISSASIASYDPKTFKLKLYIDFNPLKIKTYNHPSDIIDKDYFGKVITHPVIPGPSQNLKQGFNEIVVWDGKKPLIDNIY